MPHRWVTHFLKNILIILSCNKTFASVSECIIGSIVIFTFFRLKINHKCSMELSLQQYNIKLYQLNLYQKMIQNLMNLFGVEMKVNLQSKSKVFFGREPLNGESITTILWGQLSTTYSNVTEVAQWAAPSCSRPQAATDNGVRDGRSN